MKPKIEDMSTLNAGDQKKEKRRDKTPSSGEESKKAGIVFSPAYPARIEELVGRTGTRGEALQVRCKVLEGRDANKVLRRNIKGPAKIGDILMLRETEIEAQKLTQRRR